ncbi:calcium-binding protein [Leptolyngbya sp. DQ-M1]|uniref:calcium-binding protein n=1 Tax=Leptolyngbya sp. DQ-M1 TaxID=2933920 RepID=UPI003298D1D7
MVHTSYGTAGNDVKDWADHDGTLGEDNQYWGLGGDDVVFGRLGSDVLYGDRAPKPNDPISYDGRDPGTPGRDTLYGGLGDDKLYGDDGDDFLNGEENDDKMYGGKGNDYLDGWEGDDILYGGGDEVLGNGEPWRYEDTGDDVLVAWKGKDRLYGGDGEDWLDGSYDDDKLYGGEGNDLLGNQYLQGEPGNDEMYGQGGNDELYGGDGQDLLNGYGGGFDSIGFECDLLMGGADADRFVLGDSNGAFYANDGTWGYATIVDFHKNSQGDQILVHGVKSDYRLDSSINWFGGSASDTAIYYKNDLIGVVQDKTYTSRAELLTFV